MRLARRYRSGSSWVALAPLVLSAACSPPPSTHQQLGAVTSSSTSGAISSASAPPAEPGYDVHEWGLVRADQGDKVRIGAVAPPLPPEVLIMTKPVLYFHADVPMMLRSVSVTAPSGSVVETWPLADNGPDEHTMGWSGVSIDPKSACPSSPLPRKGDKPCSKLRAGDECESLGLAAVRTVDSSCVRVGDKTETFLFYRVETTALTPPLRFASQKGGDVLVTNDGDDAVPGLLVRIETVQNETHTLTARPPAPHGSIVVGRDFPKASPKPPADDDEPPPSAPRPRIVTGPARADIRSTMMGIGMASTEVDSFMKAWDETLFGSPSSRGFRPVTPGTTFLYFLPVATLERAAKVTFDPPPRSFPRAFAVWTHLAATGEAH
jgi:hypothetical protein